MWERRRDLRRNVLDKRTAERYVDCLHAAANAEYRQFLISGHAGYIQFECIPLSADHTKVISPALTVKMRREVGAASGQQETLQAIQQSSPHGTIGRQRKNERHAAQIFNGLNVPRTEKIGRLFPTPLFAITGVEVRCDADERLHAFGLFYRLRSRLERSGLWRHSFRSAFGRRDTKEPHALFAL